VRFIHADANTEGFRILRREPALFVMELLWRWCFGLGLLALAFIAYSRLRQAILISDADQAILHSNDPLAFASSVAAIIAGSQAVILRTLAQLFAVAAVLWIAAAAPGRAVLTRLICRRLAADYGLSMAADSPRVFRFVLLMMARVLMLLILLIGYLGGAVIAVKVDPVGKNLLKDALIVLASLAVSFLVWSCVNWVLSLAPIFVVRDGAGALDSIVAALAFIGRASSHLVAIALWNSTLRGLATTGITLAAVATVVWGPHHHAWFTYAMLAVETMAYLLFSDYLLLARLAAYCSVAVRELGLRQMQAAPPRATT
jgi:hypothetical protein